MLFFGLHYTIHDFKMPKSIPKFRKKKVAEKRQNVKVAISQKLEPIEKNQGDFRNQHNKVVLNQLTIIRHTISVIQCYQCSGTHTRCPCYHIVTLALNR